MMKKDGLFSNPVGSSAIEFAILAPVFLGFLFLLIDGAQMIWTQQALTEVASNTARCAGLGLSACSNASGVQTYAVSRASADGITVAASEVVLATNQTCQGITGMSVVTITHPYSMVAPWLPSAPSQLTARACFD